MADPRDLPDLAARLSQAFASEGIPHAVSGALAMAAYGFVRGTKDIDILVVVPSIRLPRVFEIVRGFGFGGEDRDLIQSLRDRYVAEMRAGATSVDLLVPVLPFHSTLLARVHRVVLAGVSVPLVSPEDLVVQKMLWHRGKDVVDVQHLAAARAEQLDWGYIESTLGSILPAADSRHAELRDLRRRFGGR